MFYLTMHSTHFIYGYMASGKHKKETFQLMTHSTHLLYGYMMLDHSDSEGGNPVLPSHGLLFLISSKGSFICTTSQTG